MREKSTKLNRRGGALICGAYGMENVGDEAILQALLEKLESAPGASPVTVASRDPEKTAAMHAVNTLHMFSIPALLGTMSRSRLFVSGGGSLIQNATSSRNLWYHLFTLIAAKLCSCRVIMCGCGIGPVKGRFNRRAAALVIDRCADEITLRDIASLNLLQSWGVRRPDMTISADPALCLAVSDAEEAMTGLGLNPALSYACFCPRQIAGMEEDIISAMAAAADYAAEKHGLCPVFLPISPLDIPVSERIVQRLTAPCKILPANLTPDVAAALVSGMKLTVSVRLHGLIFSAMAAVPCVGIDYDPKVGSFMAALGSENCAKPEKLTGNALCQLVDSALSAPEAERKAAAQRLRQAESKNLEAIVRLIGKE